MKKDLTLLEIQAKVQEYVNRRDRVVTKTNGKVYQAVHLRSDRGNHPLCHIRSIAPSLVDNPSEIDCLYCQNILREQA